MKINKLHIILALTAILFMAACNQEKDDSKNKETVPVNETGMPIVDEPITLEMFVPVDQAGYEVWEDVMVWEEYEKQTNIKVKWNKVPAESLEEKRNLALAGSDLPDAFYAAGIPPMELFKYGKQDVFIPLNDLIDKYAPNLKQIMEENPEVESAMTFPDGNIYALPTIMDPGASSIRVGARPWINEDWLAELDMDMPETTDDFYEYLKAVKTGDPNGNGEADEIPFGGRDLGIDGWLKGAFGVGNKGPANINIDLDPETEELRFYPTSDEYKQLLEYIHKLFDEELIEQNIFSIEENQYRAKASEGLYGSTVFYDPELLFDVEGYTGAPALEGPQGDKSYVEVGQLITQMGAFVLTNENENPAASVRWLDHFYGDEGAEFYFMGIEGETYEKTSDGSFKYLDKFTDNEDDLTLEQALSPYVPWVNVYAPAIFKEDLFQGSETSPNSLEAAEKLEPYIPEEIWPIFTYTEEENNQLLTLSSDIDKYVEEMRDKFISGNEPLSKWDDYVEKIEKMGLDDYMDIKNKAFERYKENY